MESEEQQSPGFVQDTLNPIVTPIVDSEDLPFQFQQPSEPLCDPTGYELYQPCGIDSILIIARKALESRNVTQSDGQPVLSIVSTP